MYALDNVTLTLIAVMQSKVLSLLTQENTGTLAASAEHLSSSFCDFTHHLTLRSAGTANTVAANADVQKGKK